MKNVLILFGGNSFEHEVSCKSVNFIIKNIDTNKFNYKIVGIDFDENWYEISTNNEIDINWKNNTINKVDNILSYLKEFDIVFPVIHGNNGEDGKLQGMFGLFNIKYVGCDSYSSLICYDKLLTKLILDKYSIPQVPYLIYNRDMDLKNIQYPVIVKPCKCGSSLGISISNNLKELKKSIKKALRYDNNVIIEKYIENNRELECAILQKGKKMIISDIGEIIKGNNWYDYDAKYNTKLNTTISNINENIKKDIKQYSSKIFNILNCKDLSRIDFLYDIDNNKVYFNEINTIPGFTEISMYPKLINNIGINFKDIITILLNS